MQKSALGTIRKMGQTSFLFLDDQTKQALHMMRIIGAGFHWKMDVYSPGKSAANYCYYSKYINRFFRAPKITNEKYVSNLISLLEKNRYDGILCFTDDVAYIVSENFDEIQEHIEKKLLIPSSDSVFLATNKNMMFSVANDLKIPIPKQIIPNSLDDLKRRAEMIDYPAVIKGERGAGGAKVRFARNEGELYQYYLEILNKEKSYNGKPAIQEFIRGKGFLGHVLCNDGDIIRICIHEKIVQYPPKAGVTTLGRTIIVEELINYSQKIFKTLRWNGLANIDFLYDELHKKFYFLEINPRVSGSIIVSHFAGTEMIESFCRLIQGEKVEKNLNFKENVTIRFMFPREIQYLLRNFSYIKQFMKGLFLKNSFTAEIDLKDIKPLIIEVGITLKKILNEFILKKGQQEAIKSQLGLIEQLKSEQNY